MNPSTRQLEKCPAGAWCPGDDLCEDNACGIGYYSAAGSTKESDCKPCDSAKMPGLYYGAYPLNSTFWNNFIKSHSGYVKYYCQTNNTECYGHTGVCGYGCVTFDMYCSQYENPGPKTNYGPAEFCGTFYCNSGDCEAPKNNKTGAYTGLGYCLVDTEDNEKCTGTTDCYD